MLAADKLYLEGKLARGVTRLKWKEFSLHHLNLTTVSTQASVLAGFGFAALVKFHTHEETHAFLLFGFYTCTMLQLSANILAPTAAMLSVRHVALDARRGREHRAVGDSSTRAWHVRAVLARHRRDGVDGHLLLLDHF